MQYGGPGKQTDITSICRSEFSISSAINPSPRPFASSYWLFGRWLDRVGGTDGMGVCRSQAVMCIHSHRSVRCVALRQSVLPSPYIEH